MFKIVFCQFIRLFSFYVSFEETFLNSNLLEMNIVIVGCGYWGRNFVRILQQYPNVFIKGLVDTNPENVSAELIGNHLLFRSLEQAIEQLNFDAAIVATPVNTHFNIVKQLLEAGKHVLCEKILSTDINEIEQLEQLAKRNGRFLMVGHTYLFNAIVEDIKQRLIEHQLGDILHATFKRSGLGPIRKDVGVVEDLASHDLSIILHWFGMPNKIFCTSRDVTGDGLADIAFLQLVYENNMIINIEVSWLNPIKQRLIEVIGSKQMLIFDDINPIEKLRIISPGTGYIKEIKDFALHQTHVRGGDIVAPNINYGEPLKNEVEAFCGLIETGKSVVNTLETAKNVASIIYNICHNKTR